MSPARYLAALISFCSSFAVFGMLKCPAPGPQYQEILNRLESFSSDMIVSDACANLKKDAQAMQNSFSSMGGFFGGGLGGDGSGELSVIELSFLMSSSDRVISKAKSIVDQLLVQPQCMQEYGVSALQLISSVTQQVTGLASAFSGPYGVPVSLGGAAISGILQGIDLLIQKHDYGYKFNKAEHRNLFVTNLCTYHDIRQEIVDMLYPANRILTYQTLIDELNIREHQLVDSFPLCAEYHNIYTHRENARPSIEKIKKSFERNADEAAHDSVWSHCLRLADLVHQEDSELSKIILNLPSEVDADFSKVRDLFSFSKAESGVLPSEICWEMQAQNLRESNQRSKSIISEIIKDTELCYQKELDQISQRGDSESGEKNYVDLLEKTLMQSSWARDEHGKLQRLVGDNSYQGRKELSTFKKTLDGRFFSRLAPKFVDWYRKDAIKSTSRFKRYLKKYSRRLSRKHFGRSYFSKGLPYQELLERSITEKATDTVLHSALYANTERLLTELSNAHLAMSTIEDYQEYFAKAGTLSKSLIHLEESKKALKTRAYIDSQSDLVEAMIRYLDWCHEKGYIQADGIKTLIEKIRTCRLSKVLKRLS